MTYQDLNYLLSDLSGVPDSSIQKDTDLDTLNLEDEDWDAIVLAFGEEIDEPDKEYMKCLSTVGDLLDYVNGE